MKKNGKLWKYLEIEKKPLKGLMGLEWVILVYTLITLIITLFCFTKLQHPDAMIWGRIRICAITIAMWLVYRLVPCRMMKFLRIFIQMSLLGWWYGDTYRINSLFQILITLLLDGTNNSSVVNQQCYFPNTSLIQ